MYTNVSFYRIKDGIFIGQQWAGDVVDLLRHVPEGCAAVPGQFDHLSQRVDLATGEIVDYVPPKPADTEFTQWERDEKAKRWVAKPTRAAIRHAERKQTIAQIVALESGKVRAMSDVLLGIGDRVEALSRLRNLEADIDKLRKGLKDG